MRFNKVIAIVGAVTLTFSHWRGSAVAIQLVYGGLDHSAFSNIVLKGKHEGREL